MVVQNEKVNDPIAFRELANCEQYPVGRQSALRQKVVDGESSVQFPINK